MCHIKEALSHVSILEISTLGSPSASAEPVISRLFKAH